MVSLDEVMRSADNIVDFGDYIRAVKRGVRLSLHSLDASASLEDTGYFNHSAVPDFVVQWKGGNDTRPLYIRRSFDEIAAGLDIQHLSDGQPIVLSVKESPGDTEVEEGIRQELQRTSRSSRVLIAGSRALDRLSATMDERRSAGAGATSPLAGIVASELLPEGRGLVDESVASQLLEPSAALSSQLQQTFSERAFAGMQEVADILTSSTDPELPVPQTGRELTTAEARALIPWLLSASQVRADDAFWRSIGTRLSMKTMEGIHGELDGLDLTPLIAHVWDKWQPRRGYQGIVTIDTPGLGAPQYWYVSGKLLTCRVGGTTLKFATYGQALKTGRGSRSSATWEQIRPLLHDFNVRELVLRGIDRSISVNAEESMDVQGDMDRMVESLDDQYFVDTVTVLIGTREENRVVRVDLGEALAFNEGDATLRDMIRVLGRIVAYREPIDVDRLLAAAPPVAD
jgi:hypothetical protein